MQLMKKLTRYGELIKRHLNTPNKNGVFISMIFWNFSIQLLLVFFPVKRVTRWIMQPRRRLKLDAEDITRYLSWLIRLKFIQIKGDCLALSLLYCRYFLMIGAKPTLFIGFKDDEGHAWVEVSGEVISEPPANSHNFTPVLMLPAGQSELIPVK